jgi:hypothetical protein
LRDYLIFAPLIGGALAVVYDVGFFYELHSGFFTIFSLSEHIAFAIQAIPIAILLLVVGTIEASLLWFLLEWARPRSNDPKSTPERRARRVMVRRVMGTVSTTALVIMIGYAFFTGRYLVATASAVTLFTLLPFLYLRSRDLLKLTLLLSTIVAIFCTSFSFGVIGADSILEGRAALSLVRTAGGGLTDGIFVRTGERGVLLYLLGDKKFQVIPWNDIKDIVTGR